MKQVYFTEYGGPQVLKLGEAPMPQPKAGELLVKMAAAGVSKPDFLMRTGAYPWTRDLLPFYPGLCGAGTVVGVGEDVTGWQTGDKVFLDHPVVCGCYSQYKTVPTQNATKLPPDTNLKLAAVMTNFVIAWSLLTQVCGEGHNRTLYMKGAAGGLGSAVTQLAPLAGYRIITSASTEEKCSYLRTLSQGPVFNYKTCDETKTVLELTGGQGADLVLDQLAGEAMPNQLNLLAELGTIVVYNYLQGKQNTKLLEAMIANMGRCQAVRVFSFHLNDDKPEKLAELKREVFGLLAAGKVSPRIFERFPQEDIQKAHALLDSGAFMGSLILDFDA